MGQLAHLPSLATASGCRIVALAEARPRLREAIGQRYAIERVYERHEDLLADSQVDALVISQPFHRNHGLGRQVLSAGKHLFTEKPMAGTLAQARELVDLAHDQGLIYAVGFMKRYDPGVEAAFVRIREFLESGELGKLLMADSTCFLGNWLDNPGKPISFDEPFPSDDLMPQYPLWLEENERALWDHFLNIYTHNINLLRFLLPDAPLTVDAAHRSERAVLVSLRQGEVLVSLRGAPGKSHRWEEHTTLVFERGRVEIQSPTPLNRQRVAEVSVQRMENGVWVRQHLFPEVDWAFARHARAFVASLTEGSPLRTRGEDCLADMSLAEAIFQAFPKLST